MSSQTAARSIGALHGLGIAKTIFGFDNPYQIHITGICGTVNMKPVDVGTDPARMCSRGCE